MPTAVRDRTVTGHCHSDVLLSAGFIHRQHVFPSRHGVNRIFRNDVNVRTTEVQSIGRSKHPVLNRQVEGTRQA